MIAIEQSTPGESIVGEAIPYVVSLTVAALLSALTQNRTVFLSTKTGIAIRAALTDAIYEHALKLSPAGREGLSAGEVTNLVAVDTQKLYDVMLEGHNLWSCPVLIGVVSILLWRLVGPELVVGVALLILFVPLIKVIVSNMFRIRKERSKLTDVRVNLLTVMLQGIRVTKLNHYESMIEKSVGDVRQKEMRLLRKELRMWALVLTTAVSSPLLAFGSAFAFRALVNEDNIILPSDAFSALLLFSILRFPINMTARLVGKAAQAIEAESRIRAFLARETHEPNDVQVKSVDPEKPVLKVDNGTFVVNAKDMTLKGLDSSTCSQGEFNMDSTNHSDRGGTKVDFLVREVSLSVKRGQLVAVIGKVGSGKTVLLRAILGELPAMQGSRVDISGTVGYASQLPFILNMSLRENIVFGSEYKEERYEKTLHACCLGPDIERLGDAGDMTQIGERGVTLSGGKWSFVVTRPS